MHELLARRGIRELESARAFLSPRPRHAPDTATLPNLDAAVRRTGSALERGERIGIFGDYDADGITATAILVSALKSASSSPDRVVATLPTRDQGYGLNRTAIDDFAAQGVTLLIAADCGSSDVEHTRYARANGLDVVSLDHHQMPSGPPEGAIVVSAQLPGGDRFVDLCAAGVAFVLVAALAREGYRVDGPNGEPEVALLDLVALGTIADMVPVNGINRALVRDGLVQLRTGARRGLVELCRRGGVNLATITAEQIVFKIGPRLNAAGRMGDPRLALDLLLEDDPIRAARLADQIEALNAQRRAESMRVLTEAEAAISAEPSMLHRRALVLASRSWPAGVLGPAAAQLVELHHRPAVVLTDDGECCHGSARSVPGFDIAAALGSCESLLTRFGGHGQAAGLTLPRENVAALARALDSRMHEAGVEAPIQPVIRLDAELSPDRLSTSTVELLEELQPFGIGNEQPVLLLRDVLIRQWDVIGADKRHVRVQLAAPGGSVRGVAFGLAHRSAEFLLNRRVDIAAALKIDQWNGQRRLDVEIKDFRPSSR